MTAKSDLLIEELVSAAIAFGRGQLPDWQTRIEDAKRELRAYIDEVEGLEEDSGSYDSLIPDWANEPKQRWIPVSERLPEEDTDGNTLMAICRHSGEWVRAPFGAEFADEFVRHYSYWMYAPQPPEVQE